MKRATVRGVNKAMKQAGIDGELVRCHGYFYFVGDGISCMSGGVYVPRVTDLSIDEWMSEANARRKDLTVGDCDLFEGFDGSNWSTVLTW